MYAGMDVMRGAVLLISEVEKVVLGFSISKNQHQSVVGCQNVNKHVFSLSVPISGRAVVVKYGGTMKIYWEHTCGHSHLWITLEDDSESPNPENTMCPFGHPAITSQKHIPVNGIEVSIRPAIRIIDPRSGREDFRNSYCVVLSDTHGTFSKISQKVYSWEACFEIVDKFKDMNIKMSLLRWKKMNP